MVFPESSSRLVPHPRRGAENWKNRADYLCLTFQGGLGQDLWTEAVAALLSPPQPGCGEVVSCWSSAELCRPLCSVRGESSAPGGCSWTVAGGGGREGRGWVGERAESLDSARVGLSTMLPSTEMLPGRMPTACGPWTPVGHLSLRGGSPEAQGQSETALRQLPARSVAEGTQKGPGDSGRWAPRLGVSARLQGTLPGEGVGAAGSRSLSSPRPSCPPGQ